MAVYFVRFYAMTGGVPMDEREVLHKIIEADRLGRERRAAARRERENVELGGDTLRRKTEESAAAEARRDVKAAQEQVIARAEAAAERIEYEHKNTMAELETRYEAGEARWAEQIFRTVVGLDD